MKTPVRIHILESTIHREGHANELFATLDELLARMKQVMEERAAEIEERGPDDEEVEPLREMKDALAEGDIEDAWQTFIGFGICREGDSWSYETHTLEVEIPAAQ